eukprot:TRINITY_DN4005_c0_g1_i1.p1 TRINITY_DN4005_c0_g1~~TRINITY_DN4005_c0_g1_i1.p1  ORF type:complete len:214 (-),score=58.26 TRINITY_DN4005_c0_g1_i1:128-769(-)
MADVERFRVVLNHEEQYSIWPSWKENAPGWRDEGTEGTKEEVMAYIDKVWTDMRPLSLRKKMSEWEKNRPKVDRDEARRRIEAMRANTDAFHTPQPANALVTKLMDKQAVQIIRYRNDDGTPALDKLKDAVKRQYVLVKFTQTTGGTELGLNLTPLPDRPTYSQVHWSDTQLQVTGRAKLDYTPILIHASIDLATFEGTGHVEVCEDWVQPQA